MTNANYLETALYNKGQSLTINPDPMINTKSKKDGMLDT